MRTFFLFLFLSILSLYNVLNNFFIIPFTPLSSLCCCRSKGSQDWSHILLVLSDRMRIPWAGGAKQLPCEVVFPVLLLPTLFAFGSLSLPCTIIAFLCMPLFILQLHKVYFRNAPLTKFYCSWTYTSLALIFCVYEFLVVPLLEISIYENWVFIGVSFIAILSLYKVQTVRNIQNLQFDVESAEPSPPNSKGTINVCMACGTSSVPRMVHCGTCQKCIPNRELHCLW